MKRMYIFAIVWLVAISVVYLLGQGNRTLLLFVSNVVSPASAFLPALYSLTLVRRYGIDPKDRFSRVWLYLAAGLFLWLLGEITWSVYTLVLSVNIPYPSVADLFWIAGYLPLVVALLLYIAPFKGALSSKSIFSAVAIALLADVAIFIILVGPVLSLGEEPVTQFFDFAYPILDLVLLGVSIAGMLLFFPGRISRLWVWLNLGFISIAIADILFSYFSAFDLYYDGHPLELFYFAGDIAILLGLYEHTRALHAD